MKLSELIELMKQRLEDYGDGDVHIELEYSSKNTIDCVARQEKGPRYHVIKGTVKR